MVDFEGIWQDNSVLVSSGTLAIEYWWLVWYDSVILNSNGGRVMSLIHKKSFDILNDCEEGKGDDYFEVDENIALIISLLNKKGYKTTFSCSGHAFANINEFRAENKEDFECLLFFDLQDIRYENGRYKAFDRDNAKYCYIKFKEYYSFPALPEGFAYDKENKCIEKEYASESDTYGLIQEIVDSMKALYEWVMGLEALV